MPQATLMTMTIPFSTPQWRSLRKYALRRMK
jgi:hypothetical protein